ncbi:MAG: Pyruvate flavodoxin/ferredoxin oxidoreductase domain protein [Candidatus Magasanikbacteria bacterium GW2011_GWC2_34_16]|uniref:Pyruvate flavodoxin/ferredoxin oxidoreductase domain protein n=2 Tax=Candidatus Magasanikiibacteriota TaxID=1752731 RepID=A0A0G0JU64_9BACT|nr:MAG: Pyruvate flavodoxin/ferredoxin oxidoreductase domain protein [Candidatus Magasanikbacteria bacterium GW2011_GWC2_34_16]KKQ40499.1 MAG: Pyruvate flavodoxin/ferredoxin oxidoreductase domain protein [Candidatus Magasanikbacteria bacterium GW2011_GWA2_37_8]
MLEKEKQFLTGHEIVIKACLDAEADVMYGYPITPTCEILSGWSNIGKQYLQTEDEIAAGFAVCGAVLAGKKAFTASAGPGHILLQDAFSMAEAMRLPFVMVIGQRGGPSSGTVIYSQQEVTLACYGGNGEGYRLVYSPSNAKELYELTRQAFNDAWHYRFPAVLLTDGYLLKTKSVFNLAEITKMVNIPAHALVPEDKVVHWPNIYTLEEELNEEINETKKDFSAISEEISKAESYKTDGIEYLVIAHGIVGAVAKMAVDELREKNIKVGLFRPITLRPFSKKQLDDLFVKNNIKNVVVVESSFGQLARIVRDELAPEIDATFTYIQKPGLGIEVEEIVEFMKKLKI